MGRGTDVNDPKSLQVLCNDSLLRTLRSNCKSFIKSEDYDINRLWDGLPDYLPLFCSESVLNSIVQRRRWKPCPKNAYFYIFSDTRKTTLKTVNLADASPDTGTIEIVTNHRLFDINLAGCFNDSLSLCVKCIIAVNKNATSLRKLNLGNCSRIFEALHDNGIRSHLEESTADRPGIGQAYVFYSPFVKSLSAWCIPKLPNSYRYLDVLLEPMKKLTRLDLSGSLIDLEKLDCLAQLSELNSLILQEMEIKNLRSAFAILKPLKKLQVLSLAHCFIEGNDVRSDYDEQEAPTAMRELMDELPDLVSLDISETEFAGEIGEPVTDDYGTWCYFSGLGKRHFQFLGLMNCDACNCANIAADEVAGTASMGQLTCSLRHYLSYEPLLRRALNHVYLAARHDAEIFTGDLDEIMQLVIVAACRYPNYQSLMAMATAAVYYLLQIAETNGQHFQTETIRSIVSMVLKCAKLYIGQEQVLRNCFLLLCNLRIPQDIMFQAIKAAKRLLAVIYHYVNMGNNQQYDSGWFVRAGIFLFNSLVCGVDGEEKKIIGQCNGVAGPMAVIRKQLLADIVDDVMEVCWSSLWNITDETPYTCELFIADHGLQLFHECLLNFPESNDLIRNMMGLLGNVAEVTHLRHHLIEPKYLRLFDGLLDKQEEGPDNQPGIEISYNAAGVLSHILSDDRRFFFAEPLTRECLQDHVIRQVPLGGTA